MLEIFRARDFWGERFCGRVIFGGIDFGLRDIWVEGFLAGGTFGWSDFWHEGF